METGGTEIGEATLTVTELEMAICGAVKLSTVLPMAAGWNMKPAEDVPPMVKLGSTDPAAELEEAIEIVTGDWPGNGASEVTAAPVAGFTAARYALNCRFAVHSEVAITPWLLGRLLLAVRRESGGPARKVVRLLGLK